MRRASVVAVAFLAALCLPAAADAGGAADAGRVVLVPVRPATVAGWRALPVLRALLENGSAALLSTLTDASESGEPAATEAALRTLGAGARRAEGGDGSALATQLRSASIPFLVPAFAASALGGTAYAGTVAAVPDGAVAMIDATGAPDVDAAVRAVMNAAQPRDLVIVFSPVATASRRASHVALGVIAIVGRQFGDATLLRSPSTRRAGVVTLTDIAPTVLASFGVNASMDGRPIESVEASDPARRVGALERDVIASAKARRPLTRGMLAVAAFVVAFALFLLLFRRRPAGVAVSAALCSVAALPVALYVAGAFRPHSVAGYAIATGAVAVVLGAGGRAFLGTERALLVVMAFTATVPVLDLALGSQLAVRSPLAFQIAGGGRFYGVDDGVLGVVVGAEVFAAALLLRRVTPLAGRWIAGAFAVTVWVLGAPALGAKLGAPLTAVPAFGAFAVLGSGRKLNVRAALAIVAATAIVTAAFVGVDALRAPEARSHVARVASGEGGVGDTIARKWHETWHVTATTAWTPAFLAFAAAAFLALRRRARGSAFSSLAPEMRGAFLAAAVGAAAGLLLNDEGVITATPIALFAATAALALPCDDGRISDLNAAGLGAGGAGRSAPPNAG